jgi:CRP/FNR family transcriptional regulator, dissimilatory nitrate respiration regulator
MPVDPGLLAALPPFRDVEPAIIAALAARAVEHRFEADAILFTAGATPPGMYVVLAGQVRVVRGSSGRQHVIHTEGPGGTLGEVPLFAGGTLPATAIAVEPSRCALLTREALLHAIAAEPRVALVLLGRLAARVRELVRRLDDRSTRGVTARLAEFLLARPRQPHPDRVSLGMTQVALAEELGTVREVVVRSLLALRRRGAIAPLGGGRYEITDREELQRAAEE